MSPQIADEVFIRIGWKAITTLGSVMPPRDPDEEDEDEEAEDDDEDPADEPAVVREPDDE
jgi:hypothetical protein